MSRRPSIAVLGFLPWTDPARELAVQVNPAALAAERAAKLLEAAFVPVPVTGDGIASALSEVVRLEASIVVALGQTGTEPRVERFGRVPGAWSPAGEGEPAPWLLASDADELAAHLNRLIDPVTQTQPFRASDDAGAYFCDHLCVELVRDARRRGARARFLHVTKVDGCSDEVRDARIAQYARQAVATVEWLRGVQVLRA